MNSGSDMEIICSANHSKFTEPRVTVKSTSNVKTSENFTFTKRLCRYSFFRCVSGRYFETSPDLYLNIYHAKFFEKNEFCFQNAAKLRSSTGGGAVANFSCGEYTYTRDYLGTI